MLVPSDRAESCLDPSPTAVTKGLSKRQKICKMDRPSDVLDTGSASTNWPLGERLAGSHDRSFKEATNL